jgi:hypothetical protein
MNETEEVRETNNETSAGRQSGRPPARGPTARGTPLASPLGFMVGHDARLATAFRAVAERIRERPLTSIAAALGIGFVVGGAASFRAGRLTLSVAARRLARQVLKAVL